MLFMPLMPLTPLTLLYPLLRAYLHEVFDKRITTIGFWQIEHRLVQMLRIAKLVRAAATFGDMPYER